MKYEYYIEKNDQRYRIHPTENIILRKRDPPLSPRIQYQFRNNTQNLKNQKIFENDKDDLIVKNYPKKTTNSTTIKI